MLDRAVAEYHFLTGNYLEAGDVFFRIGNYEKGLRAFDLCKQQFIEKLRNSNTSYAGNADERILIESLGMQRCMAAGKAYAEMGRIDEALEYLRAGIYEANHYRVPPTESRDREGLKATEVALSCSPDNDEFLYWQVKFLFNLKLYEEMIMQCDLYLGRFSGVFHKSSSEGNSACAAKRWNSQRATASLPVSGCQSPVFAPRIVLSDFYGSLTPGILYLKGIGLHRPEEITRRR